MTENVRSLEYLKHLAELVPGDDACECCRWAVEEIERLRDRDVILTGLREADAGELIDWKTVKVELEEWSRKRNESDERKVANLLDRARRNPPLAEWYDSPEEECPFPIDGDILDARQAVRDFQADRPGPETGFPPECD